MLSHLFGDARLAFRAMRRQPLFTAVVVGTLALGIGANTGMFALVHAALLEPLPYQDPDRLVFARRMIRAREAVLFSSPDYYDYERQVPAFAALAATSSGTGRVTISGGGRPEHVTAMRVSSNLFATLGVRPVAGRYFTAAEDRAGAEPVAMIGEGLANRRFGGARAAVGQKVAITGVGAGTSATVVGVMPASYRFFAEADLWLPMLRGANDGPGTRAFHNWIVVARLKPGVSLQEAQRQADVVARRLQHDYPESNKDDTVRLKPLQAALLASQGPVLGMLMAAVGLVLLIACANVAGLFVARGVTRRSELAVRAALGASRGRLAAQLATESLLLAGLAGAAGLVLAFWLQRLLPLALDFAGPGSAPPGIQPPVLAFAVGISLLSGALAGVTPALRASSIAGLASRLAPGTRATESKGGARLRSMLVVGQVALSLVLLVGAGLLLRSAGRLAATDVGFDSGGLLVASIDQPYRDEAARIRFQQELRDELATVPGVTQMSMTTHVPIRDPGGDPPAWPADRPPVDSSQQRTALRRIVAPGYFKTMGMRLVAGRDLASTDRLGTPLVTVVDEVLAREFFPGQPPIGQRLVVTPMIAGDTLSTIRVFEIVGVVRSARLNEVAFAPMATAYMSSQQFGMGRVNVVFRTSLPPTALTHSLRKLVTSRHPEIPVDPVIRLEDVVGESLVSGRVVAVAVGAFSSVALLLAALGLYGVLAFHVTRRAHEIGVRMALGAGGGTILGQVLARSALMVGPGLALGVLVSLAGGRLLRQFLYEVEPTDPATYAAVCLGLAVVALAASAWPAVRASRVNPVQVLRGE